MSGLYDDSVVHDIEVTVDPEDYDALIAAYQESSEKIWIEATVVIDGETYRQVGLRLKGNSSLGGLGGGGLGGGPRVDGEEAILGDECAVLITDAIPSDVATSDTATDDAATSDQPRTRSAWHRSAAAPMPTARRRCRG